MKMMKYLPLLLFTLIICSCAPQVERLISYFDYTAVTNAYGVHFTESDAVNFEYEALGSVCIIETSGYITKEVVNPKHYDGTYGTYPTEKQKEYLSADGYSVLAMVAEQAIRVGGDYVLKLNIKPITYNKMPAYEATGMIVKRLDRPVLR